MAHWTWRAERRSTTWSTRSWERNSSDDWSNHSPLTTHYVLNFGFAIVQLHSIAWCWWLSHMIASHLLSLSRVILCFWSGLSGLDSLDFHLPVLGIDERHKDTFSNDCWCPASGYESEYDMWFLFCNGVLQELYRRLEIISTHDTVPHFSHPHRAWLPKFS